LAAAEAAALLPPLFPAAAAGAAETKAGYLEKARPAFPGRATMEGLRKKTETVVPAAVAAPGAQAHPKLPAAEGFLISQAPRFGIQAAVDTIRPTRAFRA
jgi:hypothetical protein